MKRNSGLHVWRKGAADNGPWLDKHNLSINESLTVTPISPMRFLSGYERTEVPDDMVVRIEFDAVSTTPRSRVAGSKFALDLNQRELDKILQAVKERRK